jgi:hypothetical protein
MIKNISFCAALVTFGMVGLAYAQSAPTSVVKLLQNIEFKGLTGAPQTAVLYGDPTKPGVFVTRTKYGPGMKSLPHWHPVDGAMARTF